MVHVPRESVHIGIVAEAAKNMFSEKLLPLEQGWGKNKLKKILELSKTRSWPVYIIHRVGPKDRAVGLCSTANISMFASV